MSCSRHSQCMRLLLPGPSRCFVHSDDIVRPYHPMVMHASRLRSFPLSGPAFSCTSSASGRSGMVLGPGRTKRGPDTCYALSGPGKSIMVTLGCIDRIISRSINLAPMPSCLSGTNLWPTGHIRFTVLRPGRGEGMVAARGACEHACQCFYQGVYKPTP